MVTTHLALSLHNLHSAETKQAITGAIRHGGWGTADEVAELASDAAANATGSCYPIDGAYIAQ